MFEILPHPTRGTMEIGSERILSVVGQLRAADGANDENPIITVTGTDGSEDRHGTPINPRGWNFDDFKRNPVGLWSHGAEPKWPSVSKITGIRGVGGAWDFDNLMLVKAWRHLDVNMPAFIWEVYRDFGLGAMSVSFIPKKWEEFESKTIPSFFSEGVRYLEQELTEISFVNVPSNRNALAKGLERYRALGKGDAVAKMLGYAVSPIIVRGNQSEVPDTPKPDEAKRILVVGEFRTKIGDLLRCCGCYPSEIPAPEPVSDEAKALEIETLNAIASEALEHLDTALRGWKGAERDDFRWYCRDRVSNSMWAFELAALYLKQWYGEELGATIPEIDFADVERSLEGADFSRIGKVFSAKNLRKIDDIIALATELRTAADAVNDEADDEERDVAAGWNPCPVCRSIFSDCGHDPTTYVLNPGIDSSEREPDSHRNITFVSDTPDDRDGESPAPGSRDVYSVMLAD